MKRISLIAAVLAVCFMVFALAGCADEVGDEDGNIIRVPADEFLDPNNDENPDGYYVLNGDATVSPLFSSTQGFDGLAERTSLSRYVVWVNSDDIDNDKLVPIVKEGESSLIAYWSNAKDIPTEVVLEKYADRGYTLGTHVSLAPDGKTALLYTEGFSGSSFDEIVSSEDDTMEFAKINGQSVPIDQIDTNMNVLLMGTKKVKNKAFVLEYFLGTKYTKIEVLADTHVFQSEKIVKVSNPYDKTEHGFFEVKLPSNLVEGYYYINEFGLFYYMK